MNRMLCAEFFLPIVSHLHYIFCICDAVFISDKTRARTAILHLFIGTREMMEKKFIVTEFRKEIMCGSLLMAYGAL